MVNMQLFTIKHINTQQEVTMDPNQETPNQESPLADEKEVHNHNVESIQNPLLRLTPFICNTLLQDISC